VAWASELASAQAVGVHELSAVAPRFVPWLSAAVGLEGDCLCHLASSRWVTRSFVATPSVRVEDDKQVAL